MRILITFLLMLASTTVLMYYGDVVLKHLGKLSKALVTITIAALITTLLCYFIQ